MKNIKIHLLAYVEEGVNIGENTEIEPFCIIRKGACSQVRSNIPNNQIWFGNPATYFKENE